MHRRHQSTNDIASPEDDAENAADGAGAGMGDWNPNQCYIYVDLAHVGEYDAALLGQLWFSFGIPLTCYACDCSWFTSCFSCKVSTWF